MKKILICFILLVSNVIAAQHCPYDDGSSILVLKVHTNDNQNTIPNLKVSLIKKKKGKLVRSKVYILTQNNKFPFLSDEYSILVGHNFDSKHYYLKIESVCEFGDNGWRYYGTTEIKLAEIDKLPLCSNFDKTFNERVYKPIEVIVSKRACGF